MSLSIGWRIFLLIICLAGGGVCLWGMWEVGNHLIKKNNAEPVRGVSSPPTMSADNAGER